MKVACPRHGALSASGFHSTAVFQALVCLLALAPSALQAQTVVLDNDVSKVDPVTIVIGSDASQSPPSVGWTDGVW